MSFSTHGEGRWVDNSAPIKDGDEEVDRDVADLPKGQAFSVVLVKEALGNHLLNLRSPL